MAKEESLLLHLSRIAVEAEKIEDTVRMARLNYRRALKAIGQPDFEKLQAVYHEKWVRLDDIKKALLVSPSTPTSTDSKEAKQ